MDKLFDDLRGKPPQVKNRILYGTTLVVMAVVVIFWLFTLTDRFDNFWEASESESAFSILNIWEDVKTKTSSVFEGLGGVEDVLPSN